jgi:hypothetical protein
MSQDTQDAARAAYKKKLIVEGELYRVGIIHAKASVGYALRPEALLRETLDYAAGIAGSRIDTLLPTGLRWQSVMPLALTALSFIVRKKLIKPAFAAGFVAAAALAWYRRRQH